MSEDGDCHWNGCNESPTHWGQYCDEHAAEFTGDVEYTPRTEGSVW